MHCMHCMRSDNSGLDLKPNPDLNPNPNPNPNPNRDPDPDPDPNHAHSDDSGLVAYHKLLKLVRNYLRIDARQISDREMQGLWRALDPDETGSIAAGEFIKMMRKGWKSLQASRVSLEEQRPHWSPVTKVG